MGWEKKTKRFCVTPNAKISEQPFRDIRKNKCTSYSIINKCVSCPQYKVLLYSLDGRLLSTYSAYEWSLGVKTLSWSPSSQFLAIGSYDEKVLIVSFSILVFCLLNI